MELGKCPICGNKLEYYKSLEVKSYNFERYDLICETKGCLINDLEWNYSDKEKLIKSVLKSQAMIKDRISKSNSHKASKVHYSSRGKSLCGQGSDTTPDPDKVTCGNCKTRPTFILLSKPVNIA